MNKKFEHFDYAKDFGPHASVQADRFLDDLEHQKRHTIMACDDLLVETGLCKPVLITKVLNAALDAHLVQRVVDEPKNDDKSEKIEDKYTLKTLPDGQVWMLENLREKVDGAVWNEEYNCYMYTWEQAKQAVPKGFHLPSAREYMRLALAVGYLHEDDKVVAERLQEECGFTLAGYTTPSGQGGGHYWSSTQYSDTGAYYLTFDCNGYVLPQSHLSKSYGLAVRCVKD